ncbi:hypothetical protein FJY84_03980 [Candidatus Bathyarchaeota archaeon]|nr:hypothetical protein [Candidatus Bathyarchaeota archaeon]
MEKPKTDHIIKAVKELGDAYIETSKNIKEFKENLTEVNALYDHGYGGTGKSLISIGIALVMFPEPTLISDVLGGGIIAAGCLYNKINPPPIFVDDIFKTINEQMKEIGNNGLDLSRNFVIPVDFTSMRLSLD